MNNPKHFFRTARNFTKPLILAIGLGQILTPVLVRAQAQQTLAANVQPSEPAAEPQALVMSVRGACEYSEDGIHFSRLDTFTVGSPAKDHSTSKLAWDHVVKEGAVLRTGDDSRTTLFFRRIGTAVRLEPNTEIKLEKMTREMKDGGPVMKTLLDLRKGRVFTIVRSYVPGSTLEIRNAAGRSIVEGGGQKGRYIITADGTHVTAKDSDLPLKLVRETGVTIITPGQKFLAKEGKLFPLDPPEAVVLLIELDELQTLADSWEEPVITKAAPLEK